MKHVSSSMVQRAVVGLAATAFVFGPAVAWMLGVSPQAIENRALTQAPAGNDGWDALDAFSPWATDHLPGRANAVHASAWVEYNVLGQLPTSREASTKGKPKAPTVVRGKDGYLFYGQDFTRACDEVAQFEPNLKSLAGLAKMIEASGRRVVFTVAPNKSSVATDKLPRAVPRGSCASRAIERENQVLDDMRHPLYVGLRKPLADAHASGKQVFQRTDTHWSTLGAAMYAQALAERLDPQLAKRLRLEPQQVVRVGDMTTMVGLTSTESMSTADLFSDREILTDPKLVVRDPAPPLYTRENWVTRPGKGLIQGRTLLLGDSFTQSAMASLRPLFAQGRFIWGTHERSTSLITEIRSADTVIIEVVQRYVAAPNVYAWPRFRGLLAGALGVRQQ